MIVMSMGERGGRLATLVAAVVVVVLLSAASCGSDAPEQRAAPRPSATPAPALVKDAYLWLAEVDTADEPNVVMIDGVPWVRYTHLEKPQANPVTVTQWGLEQHAKGNNKAALRAARWLVSRQRPDGTWAYGFDNPLDWAGTSVSAPWVSGMAQGQALSLLERVWRITGNGAFLRAGRKALASFSVPVAKGGVLRMWRGQPFYEEYPTTERPTLVLNGFLFALIGLHEFAEATGDRRAGRLWRRGEASAAATLRLYDMGDGASSYGLAHLAGGPDPVPVGDVYPYIHVELTRVMYHLTGRKVYRAMSKRWEAALP